MNAVSTASEEVLFQRIQERAEFLLSVSTKLSARSRLRQRLLEAVRRVGNAARSGGAVGLPGDEDGPRPVSYPVPCRRWRCSLTLYSGSGGDVTVGWRW